VPSLYATVAQLRDEGVAEEMPDARLIEKIGRASRQIDRWCGWWFWPKPMDIVLDGSGSHILQLGVPICELTSMVIDGEITPLTEVRVYNRHLTQDLSNPDDRNNPKLVWDGRFPRGTVNTRLIGYFGYTDFSETDPLGETPVLIAQACAMMVIADLAVLGDADARDEARNRGRVTGLRTRDQEISYADPARDSRGVGVWTGDSTIDSIIASYRRPPTLGAV